MMRSSGDISRQIKKAGQTLGFDLIGISRPEAPIPTDFYDAWLAAGYQADMNWLTKYRPVRHSIRLFQPDCQAIISLAASYHQPHQFTPDRAGHWVSRYAWGRDYHDVMKERAGQLLNVIKTLEPAARGRICVDTAPVFEKIWAGRAGLGWLGKNSLLINERLGSWFFLAEIFVNLPLEPDSPAADRCGTCQACIAACPTGAIVAPHTLDARRCLAYLSIEHQSDISADIAALFQTLYGCDLCQVVCPWNQQPASPAQSWFLPRPPWPDIPLRSLHQLDELGFHQLLSGNPIKRIGLIRFQRNLARLQAWQNSRSREQNIIK